MNLRESFSANLRRLMFDKNMKQKDLANALNIAPSTVSSWVKMKDWPTPEHVEKIATYFGVPRHNLFRDPTAPPDAPTQPAPPAQAAELRTLLETLEGAGYEVIKRKKPD